ncbi:MAG: integrase arm-type DNA-binding domain-containing protein [Alphaproteobacteria bacterium]|nr:integrase arm-type DNA-binding domain-containing protein [Alphaproteobacteria bacterium]
MPRKAKELGALAVSRLTEPGAHAVGGVDGLTLQVTEAGARSWLLRYSAGVKRREMGLGSYPTLTVAGARDAARQAREQIRAGIDPIAEKKAARSALSAAQGKEKTFKACAEDYIAAHEAGWRNAKHREQWGHSLASFAYPKIGNMLVRDVELPHVMAILEPIWQTKTETATRLRGRIEQVLDYAAVCGHRDGLNPARWRGHLDKTLTAPAKIAKVKHYAALPFSEMGDFMKRLRKQEGTGARAVEFAILTAARSGEVRLSVWSEIDMEAAVWTVPAERMKAGKEHRVPLSADAVKLLRALPRMAGTALVFPASRGGPMSDMTMVAVLRRMGVNAVVHGFRSSFRDWASEQTNYPHNAAEMALAHSIGNKVEAAYRRGDLFEKRKLMMQDWAAFCAKTESGNVVSIKSKKVRA